MSEARALVKCWTCTGKAQRIGLCLCLTSWPTILNQWATWTGHEGYVVRSLGMSQEIGESLSDVAIFHIVRKHGAAIGIPELAPHDLRRTYAQIGYNAGVPITQISILLGHRSVETTQRYLYLELDLDVTASDFVPL